MAFPSAIQAIAESSNAAFGPAVAVVGLCRGRPGQRRTRRTAGVALFATRQSVRRPQVCAGRAAATIPTSCLVLRGANRSTR